MKTSLLVAALAATLIGAPATAQGDGGLGPHAARCAAGNAPSILVNVVGLKSRTGRVRVRAFGGPSATWFTKTAIARVQIPTPASGPIRICMPLGAPGTYAIELRHDVDGDGETERSDGGGASGDPHVTLLDFVFGRKPSPKVTAVAVGHGVREITVTAMYLRGGALRPLASQ